MGVVAAILGALFPPRTEPIAGVPVGRVARVRGTVVPRDVLTSPLTGEPCVYYNYSVEQWRRSQLAGLPEGLWDLAEHDEAIAEFYLHDATGRAIVAPERVRIQRCRGVQPARIDLGSLERRATELLIRPGDTVEVIALADQIDDLYDDARDYRARARILLLRAPDGGESIIRLVAAAPAPVSESVGTAP
ncbi:MAG: hypothetical protein D6689_22920 [Deltaproteobacteria bacterium]|nr:MAG: hypothetical protein D6689_22920 [Deltaproteobacteria bacterium]